jgi:hypothetical protein
VGRRVFRKKMKSRRHRHRWSVVSPHAINGDAGCHGKRKGRQPIKGGLPLIERLLALSLQNFLATVKTVGRNVVTQMRFTGCRLNCERSNGQEVMSAMHATLGRGFFVLLYGHFVTPKKSVRLTFKPSQ